MYPMEFGPSLQIEFSGGEWNVNGCCGGGCYVLTSLRFCPWCGGRLADIKFENGEVGADDGE